MGMTLCNVLRSLNGRNDSVLRSRIKTLFSLDAKRDRHRAHKLAQVKVFEIDQRIADMAAMRSALAELVDACEAGDAQLPCPIIDAFAGKGASR